MALSDTAFESLTERDLSQLVTDGVPEGLRLEYKRDLYGGSDGEKKEYLKDASSFANTLGGYLLIGVDEAEGLATSISPIAGDMDIELQRLESLLRDAVEPRISAVRMKAIPVDGGHVIAILVPRSWNAPHRVSFKGAGRFYGRTSAGAYELSVEELRSKFLGSATALERATRFRDVRVSKIAADEGIVPLARADGRMVLHVIPLGASGEAIVDLSKASEVAGDSLMPMDAAGWRPEFNFEGYANVRSGVEVFGYTQLFRDGAIEATRVRVVATHDGIPRIPARSFGDPIMKAVSQYLPALQKLGVPPPLAVMITLEGVRGAYLGYSRRQWMEDSVLIRQDRLDLPPIIISDYSSVDSYRRALKPAFDALWNAGGLAECTYFNEQGDWQPHD